MTTESILWSDFARLLMRAVGSKSNPVLLTIFATNYPNEQLSKSSSSTPKKSQNTPSKTPRQAKIAASSSSRTPNARASSIASPAPLTMPTKELTKEDYLNKLTKRWEVVKNAFTAQKDEISTGLVFGDFQTWDTDYAKHLEILCSFIGEKTQNENTTELLNNFKKCLETLLSAGRRREFFTPNISLNNLPKDKKTAEETMERAQKKRLEDETKLRSKLMGQGLIKAAQLRKLYNDKEALSKVFEKNIQLSIANAAADYEYAVQVIDIFLEYYKQYFIPEKIEDLLKELNGAKDELVTNKPEVNNVASLSSIQGRIIEIERLVSQLIHFSNDSPLLSEENKSNYKSSILNLQRLSNKLNALKNNSQKEMPSFSEIDELVTLTENIKVSKAIEDFKNSQLPVKILAYFIEVILASLVRQSQDAIKERIREEKFLEKVQDNKTKIRNAHVNPKEKNIRDELLSVQDEKEKELREKKEKAIAKYECIQEKINTIANKLIAVFPHLTIRCYFEQERALGNQMQASDIAPTIKEKCLNAETTAGIGKLIKLARIHYSIKVMSLRLNQEEIQDNLKKLLTELKEFNYKGINSEFSLITQESFNLLRDEISFNEKLLQACGEIERIDSVNESEQSKVKRYSEQDINSILASKTSLDDFLDKNIFLFTYSTSTYIKYAKKVIVLALLRRKLSYDRDFKTVLSLAKLLEEKEFLDIKNQVINNNQDIINHYKILSNKLGSEFSLLNSFELIQAFSILGHIVLHEDFIKALRTIQIENIQSTEELLIRLTFAKLLKIKVDETSIINRYLNIKSGLDKNASFPNMDNMSQQFQSILMDMDRVFKNISFGGQSSSVQEKSILQTEANNSISSTVLSEDSNRTHELDLDSLDGDDNDMGIDGMTREFDTDLSNLFSPSLSKVEFIEEKTDTGGVLESEEEMLAETPKVAQTLYEAMEELAGGHIELESDDDEEGIEPGKLTDPTITEIETAIKKLSSEQINLLIEQHTIISCSFLCFGKVKSPAWASDLRKIKPDMTDQDLKNVCNDLIEKGFSIQLITNLEENDNANAKNSTRV